MKKKEREIASFSFKRGVKIMRLCYIEDIPNKRYRRLLENQYQCLRADRKQIEKNAAKLRALLLREHTRSVYEQQIKAHCCDLRVL